MTDQTISKNPSKGDLLKANRHNAIFYFPHRVILTWDLRTFQALFFFEELKAFTPWPSTTKSMAR